MGGPAFIEDVRRRNRTPYPAANLPAAGRSALQTLQGASSERHRQSAEGGEGRSLPPGGQHERESPARPAPGAGGPAAPSAPAPAAGAAPLPRGPPARPAGSWRVASLASRRSSRVEEPLLPLGQGQGPVPSPPLDPFLPGVSLRALTPPAPPLPARPCLAEPVPSEPTSPEATRGCAGGRGREGAASVDGDGGFISS